MLLTSHTVKYLYHTRLSIPLTRSGYQGRARIKSRPQRPQIKTNLTRETKRACGSLISFYSLEQKNLSGVFFKALKLTGSLMSFNGLNNAESLLRLQVYGEGIPRRRGQQNLFLQVSDRKKFETKVESSY